MFGSLIDYWYYTGDSTYNDITMQAMIHQITPKGDFMPQNQTKAMGNDDQGFWGTTAMMAAENVFPNPPSDQPQWLAAAQAVFNEFVGRWDQEVTDGNCGGGLRWQVFPFNGGYDYKNSVSNGCFFNIAARLARFTGNSTYLDWATKIYEWEVSQGLILDDGTIYDGIEIIETTHKCQNIHKEEYTYNYGLFIQGAAFAYNVSANETWKGRIDSLLDKLELSFTNNSIIFEAGCELYGKCNLDQLGFKGYTLRFLASAAHLVDWTSTKISKLISTSAEAAAAICTGPTGNIGSRDTLPFKGIDHTGCGFKWIPKGVFDSNTGVGSQMNALSAVIYNLASNVDPPATGDKRGTSKGNPDAGKPDSDAIPKPKPITTADRAGAGILTVLILGGLVAACTWLSFEM